MIMGKKVISFQLFGTDPMYTAGAIENAKLAPKIYPGWICRFYCMLDVPAKIRTALKALGAEVVECNQASDSVWRRFLRLRVVYDPTVDVFLIRDCDSRLNVRGAAAVKQWLDSEKPVHIMRDHRRHTAPIMGGMWGGRAWKTWMPNFEQEMKFWIVRMKMGWRARRIGKRDGDQSFLRDKVWPLVNGINMHMGHDNRKRKTGHERNFMVDLPGGAFVGMQFTKDNKPVKVR